VCCGFAIPRFSASVIPRWNRAQAATKCRSDRGTFRTFSPSPAMIASRHLSVHPYNLVIRTGIRAVEESLYRGRLFWRDMWMCRPR